MAQKTSARCLITVLPKQQDIFQRCFQDVEKTVFFFKSKQYLTKVLLDILK